MEQTIILENCVSFQWDDGNIAKNWHSHNVSSVECEEVFFNRPILLSEDHKHSQSEKRLYLLGKTNCNRKLFIAFTIRNKQIRVISARDMSKKERKFYAQKENS